MRITAKEFRKIMKRDSNFSNVDDDNAFLGLEIIRKYCPKSGIDGAEHDIIYSVGVNELLNAHITKKDAEKLKQLNWMLEESGNFLAHFV